jgi:riboflavin synthase
VFSGIVSRVGDVARADPCPEGLRLVIRAAFEAPPAPGASVAVNGVCLTVERTDGPHFEATAVAETITRTTLGALASGDRVNLEQALRVGDELGGHWVQGHVDGVGTVVRVTPRGGDVRLEIEVPEALRRFVAPKGSIAVDGTSLTIAAWEEPVLQVALVPYTLEHTIAGRYRPAARVNLEADVVARYLDRLLEARGIAAPARGAAS